MNLIFSVSQKGTRLIQAVFRRHRTTLKVEQRQDCRAEKRGQSDRKSSGGMEACQGCGDSQAGQRGLYKIESLPLHIPTNLNWKGGRKRSHGAAIRRG